MKPNLHVINATFRAPVLEQFPNVPRAPVPAKEYESAAIECSPPAYRPGTNYSNVRL